MSELKRKKAVLDATEENADWLKGIMTDDGQSFKSQDMAATEAALLTHKKKEAAKAKAKK